MIFQVEFQAQAPPRLVSSSHHNRVGEGAVNLNRIFRRAKKVVDDRGGTDALKQDAQELAGVAKGKGSLADKAKAAADAVKDPGAPGGDHRRTPGGEQRRTPDPEQR
jgi:hypothetical protein